jgi:hypothetical protein
MTAEFLLRVAARYSAFAHYLLEVRSEVPIFIVSDGETVHAGQPGWRETPRIDPRRSFVLRSDLQPFGVSFNRVYRELLLPPGEQSSTDALFVFTPRTGARPQPSPSSPSRRPFEESGIPPA